MNNRQLCAFLAVTALAVAACEPKENATPAPAKESDAKYVGQAVGNFSAAEWYPGGELGTTDNITEGCYEDETPAVTVRAAVRRTFTVPVAVPRDRRCRLRVEGEGNVVLYSFAKIFE